MTHTSAGVAMDIDSIDFFRERNNSPSNASSRCSLVLLKASFIPYFERMEIKNSLPDEDIVEPINSSQLSYNNNNNKGNSVSRATDLGPKDTITYLE